MNVNVISAIFRRNFYSYFSNPTGYVFICVYVLLSSFAAFWPNEFFNSNLANLDQLNRYLPYIMLVFIPAITMSVWAEERRQGTDELLLTIPAADFDVVLGKYLAAVAIYSVALAFSMICALSVLLWLGNPDPGLFLGTYFGYWMVGIAMLAVGMVASFLTGNLTVGFVLGAVFNAPLAFAANADVILPSDWAIPVKQWSLEEQFRDFGRGVVSLSGVAYFGLIVVVMLYLSMVLIGRRHWQGGRDGHSMGGHYLVRALSLIALAVGLVLVFDRLNMLRADVTYERLSSLSPRTKELLRGLNRRVKIDAYVSPEVPESYVQTRLDLLSALQEMAAQGGSNIVLRIHPTKPLEKEAEQAEQQFGITAQQVYSQKRGAVSREPVYLGVAFTAGLEKVVVPAIGPSTPVEYELVRSIATVAEERRKKLGVLVTDAKLYGSFSMQTMSMSSNEKLIDELEKQYEVSQINADTPLPDDIDVLLAVQPSSLSPEQMKHFIAAVRHGTPTAIFEDPFPWTRRPEVPGTSAPKRPPQMGMFGGGQPPLPKGDISELWRMLGIEFNPIEIIWQAYNPYPKFQAFVKPEWVFIDNGAVETPTREIPFSQDDPITAGLQQLLVLYPGAISHLNASTLKYEPLLTTGEKTGTVAYSDLEQPSMFGGGGGLNDNPRRKPTRDNYVLAAHLIGKLSDDEAEDDEDAAEAAAESDSAKDDGEKKSTPKKRGVDVVLVTDIDMLHSEFFQLRPNLSRDPDQEFSLDNVTFVLNVLDELAGDDRFVEIRKRRPRHRTLKTIEETTKVARLEAEEKRQQYSKEFEDAWAKEQKQLDEAVEKIRQSTKLSPLEKQQQVQYALRTGQARLAAQKSKLEKERDQQVASIERNLNIETTRVQDWYKMWSVVLPPVLPMLVGLAVFFNRRAREREGVSRNRLR